MSNYTIAEALDYVARLSMQIDGVTVGTPDDGRIFLHPANGRAIEVKAGEPRRDWYGSRRPDRMEQITIKAPRSKRQLGYAVDQARTFKIRKDGSLNGAGILNALRTLIEDMATVDRQDKIEAQNDRDRADLRAKNRTKMEAAGLEFSYGGTAHVAFSDVQVKVEAGASGVSITLPGLSPETATAILKSLGILSSPKTV